MISGSSITVEDLRISGLYASPYTEYKMTRDGFVYGYVRAANYEIDNGKIHDIGHATGWCYIYSKTGEKLYTVDEFSNISAYHDSAKQMYYLHAGDYIRIYVYTQGRDPVENTGAFIGSVIYLN